MHRVEPNCLQGGLYLRLHPERGGGARAEGRDHLREESEALHRNEVLQGPGHRGLQGEGGGGVRGGDRGAALPAALHCGQSR